MEGSNFIENWRRKTAEGIITAYMRGIKGLL